MKLRYFVVFSILLLCLALCAHADIIANTFGPDYGIGPGEWAIQKKPVQEFVGAHFTPAYTVQFSQIDLSLFQGSPVTNYSISLTADNGGLPGSPLETWTIQLPIGGPNLETFLSQGDTMLEGGKQYWITVSVLDDTSAGAWSFNGLNLVDNVAFDLGDGWVNIPAAVPAFDVIGNPVPEPSSLTLLGGGVALGFAVLRRRMRF